MNKTLSEILENTDRLHNKVIKYGIGLSNEFLENNIIHLQKEIKNIQAIAKHMADISNLCNRFLIQRDKQISINKCIETYPRYTDHAVISLHNTDTSMTIIDDIKFPIKIVNRIEDIPQNISLYYIENLKQYAISINGIIIKGNLANICHYKCEKSARCEYGIECKTFLKNRKCNYYHEPEDYIKLGWTPPTNERRNFTVGNWIYSGVKKDLKKNPYYTRHVGSADCLIQDMKLLTQLQYRDEIFNRESQLMHDVLIYLILAHKGFVEKYSYW